MEKQKLTKKALNKFIIWSTSRYNSYLGFGNKKDNVSEVFNSLNAGFFVNYNSKRQDQTKTKFIIECSQENGEGQGYRYWRLKGRARDYKYEIDCVERSVTGLPSGMKIQFL